MKKRNPIAVFLLAFFTIFIYSWYWAVKTKGEMNKLGEKIPTAWIWLIPIVGSIWWYWKYAQGVEHVTHEKINGVLAFVVLYLLGGIGAAIIQDLFNKIEPSVVTAPVSPPVNQPTAFTSTVQPNAGNTPLPDQQPPAPTPLTPPQPPTPPTIGA